MAEENLEPVKFNWNDNVNKDSITVYIPSIKINRDDIMSYKFEGKKDYIKIFGFRYGGENSPKPNSIMYHVCRKKKSTGVWIWDETQVNDINEYNYRSFSEFKKENLTKEQAMDKAKEAEATEKAAAEEAVRVAGFGTMEDAQAHHTALRKTAGEGGRKRRKSKRRKSKRRKSKRRRTKKI